MRETSVGYAVLSSRHPKGQGIMTDLGVESQAYIYGVFLDYYCYDHFIRIEAWLGDRESTLIILEADYNLYGET